MSHGVRRNAVIVSWAIFLPLIIPFGAFASSRSAVPAGPAQRTFSSPDDAGKALVEAAKSDNQDAVLAIFGADSKDIVYSGDPVQDKKTAAKFVSSYEQMNRWRKLDDNNQVLIIGADNFAFPIPLKKNSSGQWYFDTAAGKDEILSRRIGRDELAAIEVCSTLADAQHQYFSQVRDGKRRKQYALKFISDKGTHDGLYWESQQGTPKSPLGPLVASATGEGYRAQSRSREPFHGYYFRILRRQGKHAPGGAKNYLAGGKMVRGFAFVAYPAQYGNSGIMTFIVNQDGVVYQKDLGKKTAEKASSMLSFDPDKSWTRVES